MIDKNIENIIEFEMPEIGKFIQLRSYLYVIWGTTIVFLGVIMVFYVFGNTTAQEKFNFNLLIAGMWSFCMLAGYVGRKVRKNERMPLKLRINTQKKEFWALISITNEEVKFKVDDIKEILKPNTLVLTFYLKDGTKINWGIDPKTEPLLESTLSSLGIPVNIKPFSWI